METKHTPGPWSVFKTAYKGHASAAFYIFGAGSDGRSPAVAHIKQSTIQPMEANARLIAAAPEMLEALRDMLSGWIYIRESHGDLYGVGWDRAQQKAQIAIAKATGASHE